MNYLLPPLPDHPTADCWSDAEISAICAYARAAVEAALRDALQQAPVVLAQAYRTSAAYDVGYKDGQTSAAGGCGRCDDSTKPCDITGSSCVADARPSAPQQAEQTPEFWAPPERDGEWHSHDSQTVYRTPKAGWQPMYSRPSAPTAVEPTPEKASVVEPRDERAMFEAWVISEPGELSTKRHADGGYLWSTTQGLWCAWQSRASKGTK